METVHVILVVSGPSVGPTPKRGAMAMAISDDAMLETKAKFNLLDGVSALPQAKKMTVAQMRLEDDRNVKGLSIDGRGRSTVPPKKVFIDGL